MTRASTHQSATRPTVSAAPHSEQAEQAVLGAILTSPDLLGDLTGRLTTEDFYLGAHQDLFDALARLADEDAPTDETAVIVELDRVGLLEKLPGGPAYLGVLAERAAPANVHYYAGVLKQERLRRELVAYHTQGLQKAREGGIPADTLVAQAQSGLDAVTDQPTSGTGPAPLWEVVNRTMEHIADQEEKASTSGGVTGIPTGIADLDEMLTGLHAGQMIVIGARPGMGKTSLGLDLARSAAITHHRPTCFFSLEMSTEEVGMRLLSAESRVPLAKIRSGRLEQHEWDRLGVVQGRLADAPLQIDPTPSITMAEIKAKCRQFKQRHGLDLVVIDYLQLMTGDGRANSRQEEVSQMSRACKLLAKELDAAVVVMSQLNRKSEERSDRKPQVSDLRESGAVEQDSDVILLIHRPDVADPDSPRAGEADILVGKHRNGPTGVVGAIFLSRLASFRSAA